MNLGYPYFEEHPHEWLCVCALTVFGIVRYLGSIDLQKRKSGKLNAKKHEHRQIDASGLGNSLEQKQKQMDAGRMAWSANKCCFSFGNFVNSIHMHLVYYTELHDDTWNRYSSRTCIMIIFQVGQLADIVTLIYLFTDRSNYGDTLQDNHFESQETGNQKRLDVWSRPAMRLGINKYWRPHLCYWNIYVYHVYYVLSCILLSVWCWVLHHVSANLVGGLPVEVWPSKSGC